MINSNTYPAAHKAVEILYEDHRGRFAVAAEDIELGTTIVKENPITYALHPVWILQLITF